jgi:hypothetical protein
MACFVRLVRFGEGEKENKRYKPFVRGRSWVIKSTIYFLFMLSTPSHLLRRRELSRKANNGHRTCTKRKTASRRSLRNSVGCFDQAASLVFRFLRQLSIPIAPRPLANSGSAAGIGVMASESTVIESGPASEPVKPSPIQIPCNCSPLSAA